jgi:hypothetical protein
MCSVSAMESGTKKYMTLYPEGSTDGCKSILLFLVYRHDENGETIVD